jgi:hypothetical protein
VVSGGAADAATHDIRMSRGRQHIGEGGGDVTVAQPGCRPA